MVYRNPCLAERALKIATWEKGMSYPLSIFKGFLRHLMAFISNDVSLLIPLLHCEWSILKGGGSKVEARYVLASFPFPNSFRGFDLNRP